MCLIVGLGGFHALFHALTASNVYAVDPLRTALVVNERSVDSLTIANHYRALRKIPSSCIVVLPDVPTEMSCTIDEMKSSVLKPLLAELDRRGLAMQIDLVAYSAGFPTAIKLDNDFAKVPKPHLIFTPVASLNGITSLYQFLGDGKINYVAPHTNFYARADQKVMMQNPFIDQSAKAFDEAIKAAEAKDFDAAISGLEALIKVHPAQWPLRYRIASYQALAGKTADAIETITVLLREGHAFAPMFEEDDSFDAIRNEDDFVKLMAAMPKITPDRLPPIGFAGTTSWGRNGLPVGDLAGPRYLLSVVLAVTSGRGTSVEESIDHLTRAVNADATGEASTFYFSNSSDVRSTTRMPLMPTAAVKLRELGHKVVIDQERLPQDQDKLMGVMLGSANYEWPVTCTMLPGAIADNLTSTSGVLHEENGQTSMVELLRAGAAGTSGTVTEPYALQFKFPTPLMYAYYASGATLAEAFYLSVESPYQLLIVGDPLCRPFGDEHNELFTLEALNDTPESVDLRLQFWRAFPISAARMSRMELFFSGRLASVTQPAESIRVKKLGLPLGWHEVTVTGVSKHPLQMRTSQSTYVLIGEESACPTLEAELVEQAGVRSLKLMVKAPNATRVAVEHLGRNLFEGDEAEYVVDIQKVGHGPVRLTPLAQINDKWVLGKPITIEIEGKDMSRRNVN